MTSFLRSDRSKPVAIWLFIVAAFVLAMIVVGGATRLTDSGLSITEWKPVTGAIPPMGEGDWQAEFTRYKQIPQYSQLNAGMSLSDFKTIYWWEWSHRFLGRMVGLVFGPALRDLRDPPPAPPTAVPAAGRHLHPGRPAGGGWLVDGGQRPFRKGVGGARAADDPPRPGLRTAGAAPCGRRSTPGQGPRVRPCPVPGGDGPRRWSASSTCRSCWAPWWPGTTPD
jgi:hypothetical protein